jgi:23S rRNA pseudouridine2605 synthase
LARRRSGEVSLERALSKLGACSRAQARRAIEGGRVRVDGEEVRDPGTAVVPERAEILLDGRRAERSPSRVLLLHKPRGVVTTRSDPQGRPTVFDLVAQTGSRWIAVGRLDLATSGLLLLTNDTRLAAALTDPANALPRVYLATVRGRWDQASDRELLEGISSRGELLRAASVVARKVSGRESHLVLTLVSGRSREARRLLEGAGHEVTRLKRVGFGPVELGDLGAGEFREATAAEIERLRAAVAQKVPPA